MEEIPVWEIFIQFSLTWPLVIFAPISIFLLRLFFASGRPTVCVCIFDLPNWPRSRTARPPCWPDPVVQPRRDGQGAVQTAAWCIPHLQLPHAVQQGKPDPGECSSAPTGCYLTPPGGVSQRLSIVCRWLSREPGPPIILKTPIPTGADFAVCQPQRG